MENNATLDQTNVEDFAYKVLNDTRGVAVTVMAALGDRLGLFKALAANGPATSAELAARANINERYAREWLEGMLSAGYLTYDGANTRFTLPPEHAPTLAQEGGAYFFGGTHQMLMGLLHQVDLLADAFRNGGGVPMCAYADETWEGGERDMAGVYDNKLVQQWIPAMPDVQAMLERGVRLADLGCGGGRVLLLLAQAFPNSSFVGYDVFEPNVARATASAEEMGLADRVRFEALDASQGLPEDYDIIGTFQVVHDVTDPPALLRAIRQRLRHGGRYICLDSKVAERLEDRTGPMDTLRYGFSLLYCMTTSLANGGEGLGTLGLPESKMRELCRDAGFSEVRVVPLEGGFHNLYEVLP